MTSVTPNARADDATTAPAQPRNEQFLRLDNLTKSYGANLVADQVDLSVREGELVALLGSSGCGKTTTLRMIAGFIENDSGAIYIGGKRIDNLAPRHRDTTMVFQNYALFPHMTIHDNVAFGLRMRRVSRAEIKRRVAAALDMVHLGAVADKYPRELSGGMQQRVALARAIVVEPRVLLLDEPLSNLDAKLRKELRSELREFHDRLGVTTVFVTHDIEEAFFLADRVAVMHNGRIEQFAPPLEIFRRPASQYVADFVGYENMIAGELVSTNPDGSTFAGGGIDLTVHTTANPGTTGMYAIPPHRVRLSSGIERPQADNAVRATIQSVVYLGASYSVVARAGDVRLRCDPPEEDRGAAAVSEGSEVWLHWDSGDGVYVTD